MAVEIDSARLYDRALTADEVAAAAKGTAYIPTKQLLAAMSEAQRKAVGTVE